MHSFFWRFLTVLVAKSDNTAITKGRTGKHKGQTGLASKTVGNRQPAPKFVLIHGREKKKHHRNDDTEQQKAVLRLTTRRNHHPPTHPPARTHAQGKVVTTRRPPTQQDHEKKKKAHLCCPLGPKKKPQRVKERIWNKGAQNQDPRLASGGPRWPDVPHGRPHRGHKKKRHASKRKKCARYRKRSRPLDDGGRGFGVVACRSALAPRGTKRSSPPAIDRNVAIGGGLHASKVVRGNKPICENKKNGRLGR